MKHWFAFILIVSIKCMHAQQFDCTPSYSNAHLDYNNVDALLQQGGCLWWDLFLNGGYEVPKGDGVYPIFAGAIWMGGIDENGQLKMAAQTYRQSGNDFFPGPLDKNGNTNYSQCHNFDYFWKINKSTIDSFKSGYFQNNTPENIYQWPGRNNPHLSFMVDDIDLAPFIDVNFDSKYNSDDGDYPNIYGDQSIWWVFNDYGNYHSETQAVPLQFEIQTQAFSYKQNNCLDDVTFYEYKVINKSVVAVDTFFFAQWFNTALGCFTDDYLGSDSSRNMFISYNADNVDGPGCNGYGNWVPMLGVKFMDGPNDKIGNPFQLKSIGYYTGDFSPMGDPESFTDYYHYLNGHWKDDSPITYGGNGYGGSISTNFIFPSDPSDSLGWSQCEGNYPPLDSKIVMSSGPYLIPAGGSLTFDIAVVFDRSFLNYNPCPTFNGIREKADCAKNYFDELVGMHDLQGKKFNALIYPNPAADFIQVTFPEMNYWKFELYNFFGEKLFSHQTARVGNAEFAIEVPRGIYFAKISSGDKSIFQKLIVINNQ